MNHEFVYAQIRTRTVRADHDFPHHLTVRSVYFEAEHVSRLVPVSERQVEITDRLRVDEGHGDLSDSLQVEFEPGESSGEEAGGSSFVEPGVTDFVQYRDGHGMITPQMATPRVAPTSLQPFRCGYLPGLRGTRCGDRGNLRALRGWPPPLRGYRAW